MKKIEILPVKLGGANSYLVKCNPGYILVDAGLKGAADKLAEALDKLDVKPGDIRLIIITHNHYDHTGGLEEIKELTGAPTAMHKAEVDSVVDVKSFKDNQASMMFRLIVKIFGSMTPKQDMGGFTADIELHDGMNLDKYGIDAKIVHVPGHTPGSVCVVTADGQCLIGDTLFDMFPGTHYPIIVYNRAELAESYKKLEKLNCSIYYPGHGKPITKEMFMKKIIGRPSYFKTGGKG